MRAIIILFATLFIGLTPTLNLCAQNNDLFTVNSSYIFPAPNEPDFSFNRNTAENTTVTFDSLSKSFYVKIDSVILKISEKEKTFTHSKVNIPNAVGRMYFNPDSQRILMWDFGVGRVYSWNPATNKSTRLDNSFEQKNQYGHAAWVNNKTLDIYALGGYGLFSYKTFITRFSQKQKEWFFINSDSPLRPIRVISATAINDSELFVLSENTFMYANQRVDTLENSLVLFWKFSVDQIKWEFISNLSKEVPISNINVKLRPTNYSINKVHTESYSSMLHIDGQSILVTILIDENQHSQALLTDTKTGKTALIPFPSFPLSPIQLLSPYYIASEKTFYMLGLAQLTTSKSNPLVYYKIKLKDESKLLDLIKAAPKSSSNSPEENEFAQSDLSQTVKYVTLLFFGLIIGFLLKPKFTKRFRQIYEPAEITLLPLQNITIKFENQFFDIFDGENSILELFSKSEAEVLKLLTIAHQKGNPFVMTDQLNELFDNPNATFDYIRKQRNTTIKQIEDIFQSIHSSPKSYIKQKKNSKDFRKREYALNWDLIGLENNKA